MNHLEYDDTDLSCLIGHRCRHFPEEVAAVFGKESLSRGELGRLTNSLAANLQSRFDVQPGDRVGVLLDRSLEMIVCLAGVLAAGAAYVPLDPSYPTDRLRFMSEDSGLKCIVSHQHFRSIAHELGAPCLELLDLSSLEKMPIEQKDILKSAATLPAYVIYTSGTTGKPKGVIIGHRAIVNRLIWMQKTYAIGPSDKILQKTPFSFDVSVWELFLPLISGACLIFAKPDGHKDPDYLQRVIASNSVTIMHFVPSMLVPFLDIVTPNLVKSLEHVICSGEELPADLANRFLGKLNARLHNLYGPTEAAVDVTFWECMPSDDGAKVPIGHPISNIQIHILRNDLSPVEHGEIGSLYISGVGLADGYLNRPELNRERFINVKTSSDTDMKMYLTGDLASYRDDGAILFHGRSDHQIKLRGYRIELSEVETAIRKLQLVSGVAVACKKARSGQDVLVAYCVANKDVDIERHRALLVPILPEHMIPSFWLRLNELPLSTNGKLDRSALPDPETEESETSEISDDPLVATLQRSWCSVLSRSTIGKDDNVFSLGADSILALKFLSKVKTAGLDVRLQDIFEYPTSAMLAEHLQKTNRNEQEKESESQLYVDTLPEGIDDAYPMTKLQTGLIYQSQLYKGTALYHDIMCYELEGEWNERAMRLALKQLASHHDILRTVFDLSSYSEPMQIVMSKYLPQLEIVDMRDSSAIEQKAVFETFLTSEKSREFDWSIPPHFFFVHLHDDNRYTLTISLHDSLLDGWSVSLLVAQLFECYHTNCSDSAAFQLPPNLPFRKTVEQEKAALANPDFSTFWSRELHSVAPSLLEESWAPHTVENGEIFQQAVNISKELSEQLKAVASQLGTSLKSVLLAAHMRVIGFLTGSNDVVTGLEHNVRPEERHSEMSLGLFLNTLPFRLEICDESWAGLIQKIHEKESNILRYRSYPYSQMLKDGSRPQLFDNVFNFVNFHVLRDILASGKKYTKLLDTDNVLETEYSMRAEFSVSVETGNLEFLIHAATQKFSPQTLNMFGNCYLRALESIVGNVQSLVSETSFLPNAQGVERNKGLKFKAFDFDQKDTFISIFWRNVENYSNCKALIMGEQSVTFGQMGALVSGIGGALKKEGARHQSFVFILAHRSLDYVSCLVSIMAIGAVYVPLDPRSPPDRLARMITKCGGGVLVCDGANLELAEMVRESVKSVVSLKLSELDVLAATSSDCEIVAYNMAEAQDLAYVIFTSGSTGEPKGAMVHHLGMLNHLYSKLVDLKLDGQDQLLHTAPNSFDISIWQYLSTLMTGGVMVLADEIEMVDPVRLLKKISKDQITIVELVPSLLANFILASTATKENSLECLRCMLSTGEALRTDIANAWFDQFPDKILVNAYGPTECSDDVTHHVMTKPCSEGLVTAPIGKAIINTELFVLDAFQHHTPAGVPGELYVSGICVGDGYVSDTDKTEASFVFGKRNWNKGKRFYRTGDLVRELASGDLEFLGRIDTQVKIGGHRIEVEEIESLIVSRDEVTAAAVVPNRDASRLYAFVVASNVSENTKSEIEEWLRTQLPRYMVPSACMFLGELPMSPNGKLDRDTLIKRTANIVSGAVDNRVMPRDNLSRALWDIWSDVLSAATFGVTDNFFDAGGDSLLLLQLQAQLQAEFGLQIELVELLTATTIAGQKKLIEDYQSLSRETAPLTEARVRTRKVVKRRK